MIWRKFGKQMGTPSRAGKLVYRKLNNMNVWQFCFTRSDLSDILNYIHKLFLYQKSLAARHFAFKRA